VSGESEPKQDRPGVLFQSGPNGYRTTPDSAFASDVSALSVTAERVAERAERAALVAQLKTLAEETGRLSRGLDRLLELTEAAHSRPSPGLGPWADPAGNVSKAVETKDVAADGTIRLAEVDRRVQEQLLSAMQALLLEIRAGAIAHKPATSLAKAVGAGERRPWTSKIRLAAAVEAATATAAGSAPEGRAPGPAAEPQATAGAAVGLSFCDQVAVVRPAVRSDPPFTQSEAASEVGGAGIASLPTRHTSAGGLPSSPPPQQPRSAGPVLQAGIKLAADGWEPPPPPPPPPTTPSTGMPDGQGLAGKGRTRSARERGVRGGAGGAGGAAVQSGPGASGAEDRDAGEALRSAAPTRQSRVRPAGIGAGTGLGAPKEVLYAHRGPTGWPDAQVEGRGLSRPEPEAPGTEPAAPGTKPWDGEDCAAGAARRGAAPIPRSRGRLTSDAGAPAGGSSHFRSLRPVLPPPSGAAPPPSLPTRPPQRLPAEMARDFG
jgi:hypothetical protein